MTVVWMRPRWTISYRYLSAVLLLSFLAVFQVSTLYVPHPLRTRLSHIRLDSDAPFEVVLDLDDAEIDFGSDPMFSEDHAKTDFESSASKVASHKASIMEHAPPLDRPLGAHAYTPDGLLVVNPDAPHPIFQLVRDAEAAWEAKQARVSKTLEEAVAEYKRRYRRAPPLGFDKWWAYAVKHHIQLPDEYDEIFEDIEPFWGIDPMELARSQEELEKAQGVMTIQKIKGQPRLKVVRSSLPSDMPQLQVTIDRILGVIRELEEDLPPLRITLSPFDNPDMFSSWQLKAMAREAAAKGTPLKRADLPAVKRRGWIEGCPPDSPARLNPPVLPSPLTTPPPLSSTTKTFIASHRDAMNPCTNPSLLATHGQFLAYDVGPYPQRTFVPRFSLCSTLLHHDIRPPVPYGWAFESDMDPFAEFDPEEDYMEMEGAFEGDLPWDHKEDGRLNWRGRTTGIRAAPEFPWLHSQRERLVALGNAHEGNVSVLRVPPPNASGEGGDKGKRKGVRGADAIPVGLPESVPLAEVNPKWMDIAFGGEPILCDKEAGVCDEMRQMLEFKRIQGKQEEGRYKFILDVDGNGWSGRFKRLLTSNALIFKATIYPEWYTSRIAPWVHYVPIQVSYTDLYDAVAFFRVHDELAARIAKAGQEWSRQFWRREDMTAYLYRLLLEYARVSSLDRASMDYKADTMEINIA